MVGEYWRGDLAWVGYGSNGYAADTEVADVVSPAVGLLGNYLVAAYYSNKGRGPRIGAPATVSRIVLSLSAKKVTAGSGVSLSATASPRGYSVYAPTGTVLFCDRKRLIGEATLSSGTATLNFTALDIGAHSITAYYVGDQHVRPGKSGPKPIRVIRPRG